VVQGNNEHWHRMMELAEGNHQSAVFFLGWLSQPTTEEEICHALKIHKDVIEISKIKDPIEMLQAMLERFQPPAS